MLGRRVGGTAGSRAIDDVVADVPVTVAEAYSGCEIDVPTIHGSVRARIPAGTASGQKFRLRGKGIVNARTGRISATIPMENIPLAPGKRRG